MTPTPPMPIMPPPDYAASLPTYEADMLSWGAQHGDDRAALLATYPTINSLQLDSVFYDATRVLYSIADYTGDNSWNNYIDDTITIYRDRYVVPNNGAVLGYQHFSQGLRMHWQRTGNTASRDAAIALSTNGVYARDQPLVNTVSSIRSREVAYAINSYLDAEICGEPRRTRLSDLFEQALGHLDEFLFDPTIADYAPFMFALTAEALIRYWNEVTQDARILTKIQSVADWTWENAWDEAEWVMWYRYADQGNLSPDLNLLIAPAYAWIYSVTLDTKYQSQADQLFGGGVGRAYLAAPKQFNQNYRWSMDYITWRN